MIDRISMTWPDLLRKQCRFRGRIVKLSPGEASVLSILLLNRGRLVTVNDLIERHWPNPDDEPEVPVGVVRVHLHALRCKLPGLIATRGKRGYMIDRPDAGRWYEPRSLRRTPRGDWNAHTYCRAAASSSTRSISRA